MTDWQSLVSEPLCMDWRELCAQIPDGTVDLLFLDPPYNIGVFCKMPPGEYLSWCKEWIAEGSRVLKPNGAFWMSHKDPEMLVEISRMIAGQGRKRVNWVTWDKYNGHNGKLRGFLDGYTVVDSLRSFQVMAEYLVYHADEGEWTVQCDKERGFIFEPLRVYLDSEKLRAGFTTRQVAEAFQKKTGSRTVTGMAGHWFTNVQWVLPTEENYQWLQELFNCNGGEYLRREYEDLRQEYESLRYTFNNPGKVSSVESLRYTFNNPGKVSSVWQIPPALSNGHPTPKPEALLERIILATSNEGDLVCDFFAGSFTTGLVAGRLGRQWLCCDIEEKYVELGRQRLAQLVLL